MPLHLHPIIDGNSAGETIVFVQGWPDDASVWDATVAALGTRYRCVRVNMPGYGGQPSGAHGHTTDEIVEALVELFRTLGAQQPFTLVLHDWGSYWGHAAHHRCPELVTRVVTLDVAPHYKPSPKAVVGILAYQSWLASAFALGGPLGNAMTRAMAKLAHAPAAPERLDARINYPYRNMFLDLASGRVQKLTRGYWPACPLLFVYGERKPFPFHSQSWVDHVRSVNGGEVVGLPCDHWVMRHPSFLGTLTAWLEKTAAR